MYKVLIIGVGNIGYRYFEGMCKSPLDIEFFLVDKSETALERASELYIKSGKRSRNLQTFTDLSFIEKDFDLGVIATPANVRVELLLKIMNEKNIRYMILEKVLTQSSEQLDTLLEMSQSFEKIWVNYPRRTWEFYNYLSKKLPTKISNVYSVSGSNWNLASNALHFIDLVQFLSGSKLCEVSTVDLESNWHESRKGFVDICGTLNCVFEDNSELKLVSTSGNFTIKNDLVFEITNRNFKFEISETSDGIFGKFPNEEIVGNTELQSEMSSSLVTNILENGNCELPMLHDAEAAHRLFITALMQHWNLTLNRNDSFLGIT